MSATIRGRTIDLESAWPAAADLRAGLLACTRPEEMLDFVADHLAANRGEVAGLDRGERAVAMLESDPRRPIADIAVELGVSHGHLDRELGRIVGLSPRALARLLRMRRLLAGIDVRGTVDWSDRAAELGWFDQAHLIRDFKRHTPYGHASVAVPRGPARSLQRGRSRRCGGIRPRTVSR